MLEVDVLDIVGGRFNVQSPYYSEHESHSRRFEGIIFVQFGWICSFLDWDAPNLDPLFHLPTAEPSPCHLLRHFHQGSPNLALTVEDAKPEIIIAKVLEGKTSRRSSDVSENLEAILCTGLAKRVRILKSLLYRSCSVAFLIGCLETLPISVLFKCDPDFTSIKAEQPESRGHGPPRMKLLSPRSWTRRQQDSHVDYWTPCTEFGGRFSTATTNAFHPRVEILKSHL